jgi:putative CocE/NonD family hydrolase
MQNDLISAKYTVRQVKNVRIPLSDGIYLAANLLMPEGEGRFPAILEYIPYRKDDISVRTAAPHHYFAERGFVGVQVDIRGTGNSEGVILDEYTPQEQKDACEVIVWLSQQPWCNGNVGMWGTSYGGFNAIQTAMHNPSALKAIVPHAATDDRYNDDVHYFGGCMMGLDLLIYPLEMITMNALPPYPEDMEDDWANMWRQRLEGNPPWIIEWLRHQTEDEYWRQGSLKVDYGSIKCPVFQIGGWADGYANAAARMMQNLNVPNKALIGPWGHVRPDAGRPGPSIGYLHEMVRWWAYWLRGEDTGIMQEPRIASYIQEGASPHPFLPHMPGHWRFMNTWPPEGVSERAFFMGSRNQLRVAPETGSEADVYRYQATVGLAGGFWCPGARPYGLSWDQGIDDSHSCIFTSEPLTEPLEILGRPKALLYVSSTAEIAYFVVKVSDVAPGGSTRLVSRGVLNATHRLSHSQPQPLTPNEVYELEIPLKVVSWVFQQGHCIRVAISSSDFPTIWPSPHLATNTILRGSTRPSRVILPVVEHTGRSLPEVMFQPPAPLKTYAKYEGERPNWQISRDVVDGLTTVVLNSKYKMQPLGESYALASDTYTEMATSDERPDQTYIKGRSKYKVLLQHEQIDVVGHADIKSSSTDFNIDVKLRVDIDQEPFFQRQWLETIPRFLV